MHPGSTERHNLCHTFLPYRLNDLLIPSGYKNTVSSTYLPLRLKKKSWLMKIQLQRFLFFGTRDPLKQLYELHKTPEIPNVNVPKRKGLCSVYVTVGLNKY